MDGRFTVPLLALALILASCAAPMTKQEQESGATVAGGPPTGIAAAMIGDYMDREEKELQGYASTGDGGRVTRDANQLLLSLRSDVFFDVGSSVLKTGGDERIGRLCEVLNRYPDTRVVINGHTDSTGSEQLNMRLSEERSKVIREAVLSRGVHQSRLESRGYGESTPIASNATEAGRKQNRRIDIELIPIEKP